MIDSADIEQFTAAVERLTEVVDKLNATTLSGNQATSTVTVGDRGVMAAIVACGVMFGMNLSLLVMLNAHDRKIDDLNHYISAIYMAAPHLKPVGEGGQ